MTTPSVHTVQNIRFNLDKKQSLDRMTVKFSIFYNENLPLVDVFLDESHGISNSEEFLDPILILHHEKFLKLVQKGQN